MARKKQAQGAPAHNFSKVSHGHAERIIELMREEMKKVPKEHQMTVMSQIYLTIGKPYMRQQAGGENA